MFVFLRKKTLLLFKVVSTFGGRCINDVNARMWIEGDILLILRKCLQTGFCEFLPHLLVLSVLCRE